MRRILRHGTKEESQLQRVFLTEFDVNICPSITLLSNDKTLKISVKLVEEYLKVLCRIFATDFFKRTL